MRFRQLLASVAADFDDFVATVENHEAVADCAIDDLRKAAARVRVQQGRVGGQLARFQAQRDRLQADEARWNDRAVRLADEDESKALECLRRARSLEAEQRLLAEQIGEHRRVADELGGRLKDLEGRLADLQLKRTSLSTRAARAQTLKSVQGVCVSDSVDSLFERWETAVLTDEYRDAAVGTPGDRLDRELRDGEETSELRHRLDELKRGAASGGAATDKSEETGR